MAQKKDYGLPDETLQLIAAGPDVFADRRYLQQRENLNTRQPGSALIAALRDFGTNNPGLTRYANAAGPESASARTARRGLFNPSRLSMGRVTRDVILPGAETTPTRIPRIVEPAVLGPLIDEEDPIDPEVDPVDPGVDPVDPVVDSVVVDPVVDPIVDPWDPVDTLVGGTGNDTIDGGTGNDTIDGGTGNDTVTSGPNIESSIAAILAARLGGTGGTGGGDGGSGTSGTGGLTGTGTTGGTGSTSTAGTTSGTGSTTGTGDSLRDAVVAAMGGSGASIDNSAAGLDMSSASSAAGSSLTADQLSQLTKPKVPSVTLESSGPALDDQGSLVQTFDYPELLSPEDLKAYEAWMQSQGGGAAGAGKANLDETLGNLEF